MVDYVGELTRSRVNDLYSRSRAGIVLYQPARNHMEAQPIKMFEYMAAGLPVVASDFSLWREIIEGNECGYCVNPNDKSAVRRVCKLLLDNPARASEMGSKARHVVEKYYKWEKEAIKLIDLYASI